jgi:hypothetical protein
VIEARVLRAVLIVVHARNAVFVSISGSTVMRANSEIRVVVENTQNLQFRWKTRGTGVMEVQNEKQNELM